MRVQKIKEYIAENRTEEALNALSQLSKKYPELRETITSLEVQYSQIKKEVLLGTASRDTINLKNNKLLDNLISLVGILENEKSTYSSNLVEDHKVVYEDSFPLKKLEEWETSPSSWKKSSVSLKWFLGILAILFGIFIFYILKFGIAT